MAPMTRSGRSISAQNQSTSGIQNIREGSWEFAESEPQTNESREVSEEPASSEEPVSYQDDGDYDDESVADSPSPALLDGLEDHEDVLHPLREAANRVGREVERFAEVLDGFNPLKAKSDLDRQDMTFELIDMYYRISVETVERLREDHASLRRRQDGAEWRKKMKGIKITQDADMMETDDLDDLDVLLESPNGTTVADLKRWEQEASTWDLMRRIAGLQYAPPTPNPHAEPIHRYSSEREVWDSFLESDALALERNTVLDWLKETAGDVGEDIDVLVQDLQQNAERGDIIAHGWLHTKAAIKNQKRIHAWPHVLDPSVPEVQKVHFNATRTEPLITQLDPDAPTRQDRQLEAQDKYFERAIWLGCYELLRRGKDIEEIREWCRDRTEIWRAVSMSGLPDTSADIQHDTIDYASKTLWRRMCFALARRGGGDEYERAVYGILSGDLESLKPVCRSQDDFLFAHYNSLLRSQYDNFTNGQFPSQLSDNIQSLDIFDSIQFHGDSNTVAERLVNLFKVNPTIKDEVRQPMKMLQGVLVAKQFKKFIYQQGLALAKAANAETESVLIARLDDPEGEDSITYISLDDHESLRVIVHLYLAFKALGMDFSDEIQEYAVESIVVAYINFLRLAGKEELIPLYASQLSEERCYATMGRELIDITDPDQRQLQIRLMKELGLDVQRFVRSQTHWLFVDFPNKSDTYPAPGDFSILEAEGLREALAKKVRPEFIGDDLERSDILLIRSLEWYLLVDGLWSETFNTGARLYKRFFKNMNLAAARLLATRMPSRDVSRTKTRALLGEEVDIAGLETDTEDEDLTQRLDGTADQKMLLRRHLAAEAKAFQDLEKLIEALDFIEGAAAIIDALDEANLDDKTKRRFRVTFHQNFTGIQASVSALLTDWLVTSQNEEPEFASIRESYLPEVILAYDSILHYAGLTISRDNFLECMNLATLVAANSSDLADLFMKTNRMPELVEAMAADSKGLLFSTGPGKSSSKPSKKLREKGWTRTLWNVKL